MDVKTVCLGMLTSGSASGYDLKKHFESTFSHFFAAGYGSIYPALSWLADEGLVTCECVPQDGKPDRKVYEITAAGKEYLLSELDDPNPCHKIRSEFLATMCFAHLMSEQQIKTVIASRLQDIEYFQKLIHDIEGSCSGEWPPGMHFVAGFGKAMAKAMKEYVEENEHLLINNEPTKVAASN